MELEEFKTPNLCIKNGGGEKVFCKELSASISKEMVADPLRKKVETITPQLLKKKVLFL